MNIRKWYNKLPIEKKQKIESIVEINHAQGCTASNGYNSICYVLFGNDIVYITDITKKMLDISALIYWYVSNKLFYQKYPDFTKEYNNKCKTVGIKC